MQSNEVVAVLVFKSAVLPTVAGAAVAFGLGKVLNNESRERVAAPVALFVAFAAAFFALQGFGEFPPTRVEAWAPYYAAGALVLGLVAGGRSKLFDTIAVLAVAGWLLYINLEPLTRLFSTVEIIAWAVGGLVLTYALFMGLTIHEDEGAQRPELFLAMSMIATGISLVCVLDGSVSIGQYAGALAAACGGIYLAALGNPGIKAGPAVVSIFLVVFMAFVYNAYHYVEVHWLGVLLAVIAGFGHLAMRFGNLQRGGVVKRSIFAAVLTLIPIIIAVVYLIMNQPADDYYEY